MKKIKYILIKIVSYWRVITGMILGGVISTFGIVLEEVIKKGGVYYTLHDISLYFVIGILGIGFFIGGLLHEHSQQKIKDERNRKLTYNNETIFLDGHNMTPEQRWRIRKIWYQRQALIAYYDDELTPEKKEEILNRSMEISEIRQKLLKSKLPRSYARGIVEEQ